MKFSLGPQLLHIYGPFAIHSYGLIIAVGVMISMWLATYNKRFTQLKLQNSFINIILVSFFAALAGGRILAIISEPHLFPTFADWFALWEGGLSILGAIIGVLALLPWYLKKINVPIMPFFDFVSIYVPLLQSISRIGCFVAGCCHGAPTGCALAVTYTNPDTMAPINTAVHPTQLYSSLLLFFAFLFMYFWAQHKIKKPGHLLAVYLMLASAERFFVDFLRGERIATDIILSLNQLVALGIFTIALVILITTTTWQKK